jgi:transposase
MIDGSIVRAHRHAAGARGGQDKQGLGRGCGGFSSKIHAKVDSFGMPLEFIITAGQSSDIGEAQALVGQDYCEYLLADRGYDSDPFRQALKEKGITPVIPGRKNRLEKVDYDEYTYQERNAVERFFARLKEYRRIATRYDKTAMMFKGGLVMASILIWIKL